MVARAPIPGRAEAMSYSLPANFRHWEKHQREQRPSTEKQYYI